MFEANTTRFFRFPIQNVLMNGMRSEAAGEIEFSRKESEDEHYENDLDSTVRI